MLPASERQRTGGIAAGTGRAGCSRAGSCAAFGAVSVGTNDCQWESLPRAFPGAWWEGVGGTQSRLREQPLPRPVCLCQPNQSLTGLPFSLFLIMR